MRTSFMANKCCCFFFISAKRLKSVHNTAHRVLMHMYLKSHLIGILKCFKWLISLLQPNIHRHTLERKKKLQSLLFMNKWTELIAHWAAAHKNYFLKNLNSFRMNMKRKEEKKITFMKRWLFYENCILLNWSPWVMNSNKMWKNIGKLNEWMNDWKR